MPDWGVFFHLVCILSAYAAAKCRKWKHSNEVRKMQTKTAKRDSRNSVSGIYIYIIINIFNNFQRIVQTIELVRMTLRKLYMFMYDSVYFEMSSFSLFP